MAVELKTPAGGPYFVMTFGRIQDPVDPCELEAIVLKHASNIGLSHATSAEVCWSLRDARDGPYFYEALLFFAAELAKVPSRRYERWRRRTAREMSKGKHLWYLGRPERAPNAAGTG